MRSRAQVLASSLAEATRELEFLALHDGLTKLPNRTLLERRLQQQIDHALQNKSSFSVHFLNIDGFKQINDAYGHEVGDLLLLELAHRIREDIRLRDTLARLGGDEFVLIADTAEPGNAARIAGKLIELMEQPFDVTGHTCEVTVSIGIAMCTNGDLDRETLLKHANAAMYRAKALGRNTYCFFDASMNQDSQKHLQIFHELRQAVDRRELVLNYQPKFDARSGAMIGAEALIRWNHPVRGLVAPGEFIPLAERIGLIVPIGKWTIHEACRQMAEWRASGLGEWPVSVNLSAVQFNHPGLVEVVQENLAQYSLEPGALILEITESTAMSDPDASMAILKKLHRMGVRISIDDFGTGYSSLLYLKRLPAAELKIDRGFVRDLAQGTEDAAIIAAIVALGRSLNLEIVGEGVETTAQREFLTKLGCTSLQGFLLGRPMPPAQLIDFLAKSSGMWRPEELKLASGRRFVAHVPVGANN